MTRNERGQSLMALGVTIVIVCGLLAATTPQASAATADPATSAAQSSASAALPPARAAAPRALSQDFPQLVNDPGFEGGNPNSTWATYTAGTAPVIARNDPHSGQYNADLCGYPSCTDYVQQTFTVPDNVSQVNPATFTMWVATSCPARGGSCSQSNNGMHVVLSDGSSSLTLLGLWQTSDPSSTTSAYKQWSDTDTTALSSWLAARPGTDVTLSISAATVGTSQAEWFVDDLALDVTAQANPPTTDTATSPAAGQVTFTWTDPTDASLNHVTGYLITLYTSWDSYVSQQTVDAAHTSFTFSSLPDGVPYSSSIESVNQSGTSYGVQSNSVTPFSGAPSAAATNATSTSQYSLPNSDGAAWQRMDEHNLSFEMTPTGSEQVLLSANADLWTATSGYNQDIGICVVASPTSTSTCGASAVVAWKESGGSAGTYSPNAAFVQTVVSMTGGTTYRVDLVWKTNRFAVSSMIAAGAGTGSPFSPTSLTARVLPATQASMASTHQYELADSDGQTWQPVDNALKLTAAPSSTESVVISANADLWTGTAGVNQDLGVTLTPAADCGGGTSTLAGWKESGGFAGAFSPNAAFLQTVCTLQSGRSYAITLVWKANRQASGTSIFMGAGNSPAFSPTRLTMFALPADASPTLWQTQVTSTQTELTNNGATWVPLAGVQTTTLSPSATEPVLLSANADLFTATSPINQDLGIFVSVNGGEPALVGWKESGGGGGEFSPNAAFVQVAYTLSAGNTYVFSLQWKTNVGLPSYDGPYSIFAGAGTGNPYSPTRLLVVPA